MPISWSEINAANHTADSFARSLVYMVLASPSSRPLPTGPGEGENIDTHINWVVYRTHDGDWVYVTIEDGDGKELGHLSFTLPFGSERRFTP